MSLMKSGQHPNAARLGPLALVAIVVVSALLSLGFATHAPSKPPPRLTDPTATANRLLTRYFTLLERNDVKGLQRFLSPAFQVERADGSGSNKAEYVKNHPSITKFSFSEVTGTQSGSVLVVRYLATIEGVVNGKPETPAPAPRLTVFSWDGKTWRLAAHANFNPLTG